MNIGVMVEGDGEVEAIPLLLRKILHHSQVFDVEVSRPIRVGGLDRILNGALFPKQLEYACSDPDALGLLITADCDDGCVLQKREMLVQRVLNIVGVTPRVPIDIVLFNREYESLFLSQADILEAGTQFFRPDNAADLVTNWETYRDAKGRVKSSIQDFSYKESRDQGKLTAHLNIDDLSSRHRAGRKLMGAVETMLYS